MRLFKRSRTPHQILSEVEELLQQRFLPVSEECRIIGVVTDSSRRLAKFPELSPAELPYAWEVVSNWKRRFSILSDGQKYRALVFDTLRNPRAEIEVLCTASGELLASMQPLTRFACRERLRMKQLDGNEFLCSQVEVVDMATIQLDTEGEPVVLHCTMIEEIAHRTHSITEVWSPWDEADFWLVNRKGLTRWRDPRAYWDLPKPATSALANI